MSEVHQEQFLPGFWYAALPSSDLKRGKMRRQILLNRPLLLLRDTSGNVTALDDHCPHRGIPLSDGSFDGRLVECCYHGWKFDTRGKCIEIPSLMPDSPVKPERIQAGNMPCKEADGLVWVFLSGSSGGAADDFPKLQTFSEKYKTHVISNTLKCNVDHGIIGLMDPAHGPFVHQAWWWRNRASIHVKSKKFEPIPNGFRMVSHAPSNNSAAYKLLKVYKKPITTTIEFVLPNRRLEIIRCGDYWFSSQAVVTPITLEECRLDFVAAWNILNNVPFVTGLYKIFAQKFIRQDQQIMEKQSVGLRDNPKLMLIDDADTLAKWYFALKEAYLTASRTGGEMIHPISGPKTLNWRS